MGWKYHYSNTTMNWTEARKWCQRTYTDMVVIQNQRENDYLVSLLPNRNMSPYFWIGITKNQKNETWTWIGNNSTWIGEQSWAANEPNNNHIKDFCVEIDHTVTAGSNNLIIILMVAKQFPVDSVVIYCTLHANHGPQTLCLLTAIIGFTLMQRRDGCTRFAEDAPLATASTSLGVYYWHRYTGKIPYIRYSHAIESTYLNRQ